MTEPDPVQSPRGPIAILGVAGALAAALVLLIAARPLLEPVGADLSHREIKRSTYLPVVMWCLGWPAVAARRAWWAAGRPVWTLGCCLLFVHVAIAFHLGHGWSHRAAWDHTRAVGGYGDGIFVNYVFALVWFGDVIWCWAAPGSYLTRPGWLHWSIHGFLAFVVFNAAVVFADRSVRGFALVWLLTGLLIAVLAERYHRV
jgi:hypothetical protein